MPNNTCGDHFVITRNNGHIVVGIPASCQSMDGAKAIAQAMANDEMNSRRITGPTVHYVIETWNGDVTEPDKDDIHVYGKCDHNMAVSDSYCNNCGRTLS